MSPGCTYEQILTGRGIGFQLYPAAGKNMDLLNTGILNNHLPVNPEKHFRIQQLFQVLQGKIQGVVMIFIGT
jgi:hypothetical protein